MEVVLLDIPKITDIVVRKGWDSEQINRAYESGPTSLIKHVQNHVLSISTHEIFMQMEQTQKDQGVSRRTNQQ